MATKSLLQLHYKRNKNPISLCFYMHSYRNTWGTISCSPKLIRMFQLLHRNMENVFYYFSKWRIFNELTSSYVFIFCNRNTDQFLISHKLLFSKWIETQTKFLLMIRILWIEKHLKMLHETKSKQIAKRKMQESIFCIQVDNLQLINYQQLTTVTWKVWQLSHLLLEN
jgi:hypothetical protein